MIISILKSTRTKAINYTVTCHYWCNFQVTVHAQIYNSSNTVYREIFGPPPPHPILFSPFSSSLSVGEFKKGLKLSFFKTHLCLGEFKMGQTVWKSRRAKITLFTVINLSTFYMYLKSTYNKDSLLKFSCTNLFIFLP